MPRNEDRGIAVMRGVAANDNPGSGAGTGGGAEARVDTAVVTLARLIGGASRARNWTGSTPPTTTRRRRMPAKDRRPEAMTLRCALYARYSSDQQRRPRSRTSSGSAASARRARAGRSRALIRTPPFPATA